MSDPGASSPGAGGQGDTPADATYYPGGDGRADEPRLPARGKSRIFGTVLGKDGLPVQLVLVSVRREEDGGTLDRKPNARGEYEAVSLAGGTYVVTCVVQGEAVLTRRLGLAEGEQKQVDFSVASGIRLFGWVSRGGRAVADTQVVFSPEHGADVTATFAKTDAQGNYEVRGVPPGAVLGRVGVHDHRIWVPEGLDELRYDIALPEGVITGSVYEGRQRKPSEAVSVEVYRAGDPKADLSQHAARWVTGTTTDVDGRYELAGLKGGEYWIHVKHPKYGTHIHGPVALADRGAAEGVDIYMGTPGKIAGFVLDSSGLPIEGATASVRQVQSGEPVLQPGQLVPTNPSGVFLVDGVPPGRYRVTVHARGFGQQTKVVDADDGLTRVQFILAVEGLVRVHVFDSGGRPVEHAVLVLWDTGGEPIDPAPGEWGNPSRSQSDVNGFVTRGGLSSGRYHGEVASAFGRTRIEFSVTEGQTTEVAATVQPVPEEER